jgi:conjugative transfer region protein TrbK
MDPKTLSRTVAILLLAATLLACAVEVAHLRRTSESPAPSPEVKADPLAAELARCKALGTAAANDMACKAAWSKNRERFFAPPNGRPNSTWPDAPPKAHTDRVPSRPLPDAGTTESNGR